MLKPIAAVAALLLFASPMALAADKVDVLVSPAWLATHAADKDLVVLMIGDRAEFEAKHIPGARFVASDALSVTGPGGLVLEMPDAADLEKRLEALGVSDSSHVIVAYGRNSLPPAARVMFTLEAAGLGDRASLLDGGLAAWEAAGKPVTAEATPAKTGSLSPLKVRPLIVDAAFVQGHLASPGYAVVDARAKAFYDGAQAGGSQAAPQPKGHVKGAKSVPFSSISDPSGAIKTPAQLAALFKEAGVKPGDKLIAYCHVGQQATVVLLGAKLAGVEAVLYDGSYQDWAAKNLPVDGPAN